MERIVNFSEEDIKQIKAVYRSAVDSIDPEEVDSFLKSHGCPNATEEEIKNNFSQDDWSEEDFDEYNRIFSPAAEVDFDISDEVESAAFDEWEAIDGDFEKSIEAFNKYGAIDDSENWQAMRKALLCTSITGW